MSQIGHIQFNNKELPLAVVVTRTSWNEPPRIRHQLTRQFSRFYNVLYIERPAPNVDKNNEPAYFKVSERILVCKLHNPKQVPIHFYANIPFFHSVHNKACSKLINRIVHSFGFKKNILVNFLYDFPEIMIDSLYDYKLYICSDEFLKMLRKDKHVFKVLFFLQYFIFKYYEYLVARNGVLCLAVSQPLLIKLKKINKNTMILYPGHEFDIEEEIKFTKRKSQNIKVAFMGYITHNLHYDWLRLLSIQNQFSVYMIGPLYKIDYGILLKLIPNVNYIPPLIDNRLKNTLENMDVLIMPYDTNIPEINAITAPNKLFQYIAVAKPIVISNMPNFIQMPYGIIYRAHTAEDFIEKIKQAYKEDCQEYVNLRLKIAAENTWDKRGDKLHNIIKNNLFEGNVH